ncbi:sensor histidine kinase [Bdellovibrio sp. HCB337]|uniref:sensor histidine kinase n=1 Tax=Bdellovibrio sp. HCB337 TaxID=3394358 RepID=UPI0039A5CD40
MSKIKTILATVWFFFVVSLVGWWWVYAMNTFPAQAGEEMLRKHRMFMWEGTILLAALIIGGVALVFLSYRDEKRHNQLKTFFAAFSHDIKTSITRLRLQAEVLEEDNASQKSPVLQRLINDISRLDLQLENSLLLATTSSDTLLREKITLSKTLESLRIIWGELEFRLSQNAEMIADSRAITSVIRNIIQNAALHGEATVIEISAKAVDSQRIQISITDNGKGFQGNASQLGAQMMPSNKGAGSGIGLYLGKILVKKMNGDLSFENANPGLKAVIQIEGRLL